MLKTNIERLMSVSRVTILKILEPWVVLDLMLDSKDRQNATAWPAIFPHFTPKSSNPKLDSSTNQSAQNQQHRFGRH